jgi:tetratricopeptide (TPR) repeat protein
MPVRAAAARSAPGLRAAVAVGAGASRRVVVAVALCVLAASAVVRAQEESPCQALAEAGASAVEVRQCYISQTQRQPSNAAAWMALGTDFHTEGETGEAATAYRNAIRIAPDSDYAAKAHLHLGVIFHSQGELDEALDAYRASVALRPNPDTLLNMAIILHQRGDHAEALESCQRAIEVNPQYFGAYAQLAILQQSSGDVLQAVATYQQAIALKPDYGPAYFNLGTAYEHAGDLPKAIEQYQTAITLEPAPEAANPKFHSRLASALVEAGQLERDVSQVGVLARERTLWDACVPALSLAPAHFLFCCARI